MRSHARIVSITLLLAGLSSSRVAAKEEKVSVDQVPAKVVEAEKAKWPRAEILGIEREEEDGKTTYEFGLKEGKRKWDASFTIDGKLVVVEETIAEKEVPLEVKQAQQKKYPAAKVVLIEKVTEGEGGSAKVFYEFKIKTKEGGVEAKFDPTGKLLGEEQKKGDEINE